MSKLQFSKDIEEQGFFKDKDGHWALWQWPNILLFGWLVGKILSLFISQGHWHTGLTHLSTAFLFSWSYLEITKGASYFRRLLGLVVMIAIVVGFFK